MRVFGSILLCVSLIGCVAAEGDESFVIFGNLAEPTNECIFTPSKSGPFISNGFVDVDFATTYRVASMFESRIVAAEGRESLRTISVQGANISLEISEGTIVGDGGQTTTIGSPSVFEFQSLFSTSVQPNGGIAVAIYDLIPFQVMLDLQAQLNGQVGAFQVVSTVTAFGDYYGDRLDSQPFQFAVTVGTVNRTSLGLCPINTADIDAFEGGCPGFQDVAIPCCGEDTDGDLIADNLICPAIVMN